MRTGGPKNGHFVRTSFMDDPKALALGSLNLQILRGWMASTKVISTTRA